MNPMMMNVVAPTDLDEQQSQIASYSAEVFKDLFYFTVDQHRDEAIHFFRPDSVVIWNGNPINGLEETRNFFKMLPATKHELTALDAHNIIDQGAVAGLLVITTGTVQYGINEKNGFHHTFVLTKDRQFDPSTNKYYVASATFRRSKADRMQRDSSHHNHRHHNKR